MSVTENTKSNEEIKDLISKMTLEEKAAICDGDDSWHLKNYEKLGIPPIMVADGPHGLRKRDPNQKSEGLLNSVPAVCFPTAVTTACSWDRSLLYEMGEALADECRQEKVSVVLGPGVNMKRSPLCGRNFEYFSEDPLLAGEMGAAFIQGVQSKGVGTSLKHFAVNSQETRRMTVNAVIDERTLREIYLAAFETAVKEGKPWTVMSAYNRLNGEFCTENEWLQHKILREEWGYEGVVVSDWGAVNDRSKGLAAGNDLEMPSSFGLGTAKIIKAVQNGELSEEILNERTAAILQLIFKGNKLSGQVFTYDKNAHHTIARKIAGQSMVLLKNDGDILPLKKGVKVAVIGEMAKVPRYQGAGSSLINPTRLDNAYDCLKELGVNSTYAAGYSVNSDKPNQKLIDEAVEAAKSADIVLLFIGLTAEYESEGFDREHMKLPVGHNALTDAVSGVNPNTIVILSGGSPVEMPWLNKIKALLNGYLGGQAGAGGIADILTGAVTPSGKLAETYPCCAECTPCFKNFPGNPATVEYRESIYIGYRYYDKIKKNVVFPFGYGLSYTQFDYYDMKTDKTSMKDDEKVTVTFMVKNTGNTAGAEIAQLYIADEESTIFRAPKELKGFEKVFLNPGEEKEVSVILGKRAFAYYNTAIHDWHVESGSFDILVGASAADIKLKTVIQVESTAPNAPVPDYKETAPCYFSGEIADVPDEQFEALLGYPVPSVVKDKSLPIDITDNFENAAHTKWGSRFGRFIGFLLRRIDKGENSRMMNAIALQTPIRSFVSMSGGLFTQRMAEGLLRILNADKPCKGLRMILGGIPHALLNAKKVLKNI